MSRIDDLNLLIDVVRCLRLVVALIKEVAPYAANAYETIKQWLRKTKRPNSR